MALWVFGISGYVAGIEATCWPPAAKVGLMAAGTLFGGSEVIINLINNRDLEREIAEWRGKATAAEQEKAKLREEKAEWGRDRAEWSRENAEPQGTVTFAGLSSLTKGDKIGCEIRQVWRTMQTTGFRNAGVAQWLN